MFKIGNVLILGAGRMAKAVAYDLAHDSKVNVITIAARSPSKTKSLITSLKSKKIKFAKLDLSDEKNILQLLKKHDCAISAVPYTYNYFLAKLAIKAKCHFVDLGGNNDVVKKEFSLSKQAKEKNVTIIPDAGLAPGLVSNLVALGLKEFDKIESIKLRVGGLPQHPKPPLNYMIVFSVKGLINEYVESAIAIETYKIKKVLPMQDLEKISFPGFGQLEAFNTSGGTSTLPQSFKGKIKSLNYKTIRYPGHANSIRLFMNLGFTSNDEITIKNQKIKPRDLLEKLLLKNLSYKDKDVVLLKVVIENKKKKLVFELIDYEKKDLTAMMRCTGFPAATIVGMILRGEIKKRGTLKHEFDVPPEILMERLRKKGLNIVKKKYYK